MKTIKFLAAAALGSALALLAAAQGGQQRWPDYRGNELESLWLEGSAEPGWPTMLVSARARFTNLISGCRARLDSESEGAAEWIRAAFHDMATHNVNGDGLGGLDRSLLYELDRPENAGGSLAQAMKDLSVITRYISGADIIALGVVHSVVECGGLLIPFRGRRIDATEAGPKGVPEVTQTLEEHTEKFRKQGFNKTEMIELVACGHTLGGVGANDFPEIVSGDVDRVSRPRHINFDSTSRKFDNAVVTEYLKGTTKNILVVHPNATIVSDKRIFESDGNRTMETLADEKIFQTRCRDLFEKMINTVPKDVELTDVFAPIKAKVGRSYLTFNQTMGLHTEIRFLTKNENRRVTLKWEDRASGGQVHSAAPFDVSETLHSATAKQFGITPIHYWFNPTIDPTTSISRFWFEVDEGTGGQPDLYDNGGAGFPIAQDKVIWARDLSYYAPDRFSDHWWSFTVAIRNDAGAISNVSANVEVFIADEKLNFVKSTVALERDTNLTTVAGFDFYTFRPTEKVNDRMFFDVAATIGGETVTEEYLNNYWVTVFNKGT
ncbi:heme peroxidase [Ephemerocybe angulata]|uniref:Peroxidase n=1 Tax=Ephemerocybe angulata TaxID=980116 RepID=A0A8H6IGH2_9AGAR|nr:heme peroxidase [Tulosesus angulatus]